MLFNLINKINGLYDAIMNSAVDDLAFKSYSFFIFNLLQTLTYVYGNDPFSGILRTRDVI